MPDLNRNTIFSIISKLDKRPRSIMLSILIMLPIFNILLYTIFSYETDLDIKAESDKVIDQLISNRYDLITATITENCKQAKVKTDVVRSNILKDLEDEYGDDYDRMKRDYTSKNPNSSFYLILSKHISGKYMNIDSSRNRMFIANRQGILIDNSLDHFKNSFADWESVIAENEYETLLSNSLNKLNVQDDNLILWINDESNISTSNPAIDTDKPVSEFIHSQIINNRISALNKFSIVVASYIFDHEDIFGVPDIIAGQFTNNDKIYIVQLISIYDIIRTNPQLIKSINNYDISIETQKQLTESSIKYRTVITVIFVLLEIIIFFGMWYLVENYMYHTSINKK